MKFLVVANLFFVAINLYLILFGPSDSRWYFVLSAFTNGVAALAYYQSLTYAKKKAIKGYE